MNVRVNQNGWHEVFGYSYTHWNVKSLQNFQYSTLIVRAETPDSVTMRFPLEPTDSSSWEIFLDNKISTLIMLHFPVRFSH